MGALQEQKPRQWPPREALAEMLKEGRDTWIADLLGCDRNELRIWRRSLGIPSFGTGGRIQDRAKENREFVERWAPKLAALGIQTV